MDRANEHIKPTSVRTVGLVVAIVGALIVFSNASGALMYQMMEGSFEMQSTPQDEPSFGLTVDAAFRNYLTLCLTMVAIGAVYFVGGLFLRKYRRWASFLITALTALLILGLWWMMAGTSYSIRSDPQVRSLWFFPFVVATAFTIPLALLIRFLNRTGIKEHFT